MDITIRQIELFLALAETPNITTVARDHFLTQSAVSVAIKRFESAMGTALFDRAHRRLTLSNDGKLLYEQLAPLMENMREIGEMFRSSRMEGEVVVGASSTIADYVLPQILFDFQCKHPDAQVVTITGNSRDIVRAVETGEVSVGFIENEVPSKTVDSSIICTDEMIVVSSSKEFAHAGEYEVQELMKEKWILRERGSGTRETFYKHLGEKWDDLNIFMEVDHMASVLRLLRNPGTLSCLSPHCIRRELREGELFPIRIKGVRFTRQFYTAIHQKKYRSRLLDSVIASVEADIEKRAGELHDISCLTYTE